jgi:hypothetical protein
MTCDQADSPKRSSGLNGYDCKFFPHCTHFQSKILNIAFFKIKGQAKLGIVPNFAGP